jgi:Ca2+-binding RTX toxin-like protein
MCLLATTSIPGGGDHNVTVYGNGTVIAGSGNDSITLGSGKVIVGNGRDTINVLGNGTVIAGSGYNQINVQGSGSIAVGAGHDTISLFGSGQIVQTGILGRASISIGRGNDTISVEGNATVQGASLPCAPHASLHTGSVPAPGTFGGATVVGGGVLQVNHLGNVVQDIAVGGTMTLLGSTAHTEFVGGSGTTVMRGGSGQDTFIGGSGNDTMSGVGRHNVFEFLASAAGGHHVITNFVSGDQLNVDGHSLSYLFAHNQVTTHDGNTYISADGGRTTIELAGVTLNSHGGVSSDVNHGHPGLLHPPHPLHDK